MHEKKDRDRVTKNYLKEKVPAVYGLEQNVDFRHKLGCYLKQLCKDGLIKKIDCGQGDIYFLTL